MTHGLKLASPMGFPRQEYQSKLPFPTSGDLSDPGTEPLSPASPALTGGFFTVSAFLFFFFSLLFHSLLLLLSHQESQLGA